MDCKTCNGALKAEDIIKCAACNNSYHYVCVGLSEVDFKKILPMNKIKWKCPSCKPGKKKMNTGSPSAPGTPSSECGTSHSMINIDANAIMEHFDSRFNALQLAISSLKTDVNDQLMKLSATVNSWEAKINSFSSSIANINVQISDLKDENNKLNQELDQLRSKLKDISDNNQRNDQWVRRSNIQINGIPEKKGENLLNLVRSLAQKCGFSISVDSDVDFVTRVAVKNDADNKTPKPIILKMHSRYKKDDFLTLLRKIKNCTARDIGITGAQSGNRIFFNDHLSARNKYLLNQAKKLAREKGYVYCWVRNCTVMVRRNDQSPIIHISSEQSLNKIV
ncbi:uncharacterized protein LOC114352897 [Ostrinia furnacalis]|uniref:uncharacterized protein LOC114352897 n=1 Tax=Ostrinia furnacalis TaxID=93504 RepID=UPI001040C5BE|nr:uncharacterized protein LOC114352897 [Ostrinia furnacalis]